MDDDLRFFLTMGLIAAISVFALIYMGLTVDCRDMKRDCLAYGQFEIGVQLYRCEKVTHDDS